MDSVLTSLIID